MVKTDASVEFAAGRDSLPRWTPASAGLRPAMAAARSAEYRTCRGDRLVSTAALVPDRPYRCLSGRVLHRARRHLQVGRSLRFVPHCPRSRRSVHWHPEHVPPQRARPQPRGRRGNAVHRGRDTLPPATRRKALFSRWPRPCVQWDIRWPTHAPWPFLPGCRSRRGGGSASRCCIPFWKV